jgi:hypothetical protein
MPLDVNSFRLAVAELEVAIAQTKVLLLDASPSFWLLYGDDDAPMRSIRRIADRLETIGDNAC